MNKKGVAEPIVDIFAFFAVILLFVVFGAIFSFMTQHHVFKLEQNTEEVDADIALTQILRTPVEVNGYKTDYAGFIALAERDAELQEKLEKKLGKLLEDYVEKTNVSAARIVLSDYKKSTLGKQMVITEGPINRNVDAPSKSYDGKKFGKSIIEIPGFKGNKITISMRLKNE